MEDGTFQLTASRRGWRRSLWTFIILWYFNSQPHEEADSGIPDLIFFIVVFQLTASRRGWRRSPSLPQGCHLFQLTASRRGWRCSSIGTSNLMLFQLTASRRGWPAQPKRHRLGKHFNSQPHEEADLQAYACTDGLKQISTHSLTKRLTSCKHGKFCILLFQLTASRRGWRQSNHTNHSRIHISTHSLTKRLTRAFWI